ncbi:MAG: rimP [Propionibacteriaceae bacterium]|jgi:ribosome maturation factor RimP|nr:rimP [Propionibacteriaceae bacterium]
MRESSLTPLLTPILAQFALELEAVDVVPAGKRRLVRIIVDGDGPKGDGPLLDDIAAATKAISIALDESDVAGNSPYTLEVSSRGVARPLTLPRHWRRNAGRLVEVSTLNGEKFVGRVVSSNEDSAALDIDGTVREISYADVAKALVQVELNRKSAEQEEED